MTRSRYAGLTASRCREPGRAAARTALRRRPEAARPPRVHPRPRRPTRRQRQPGSRTAGPGSQRPGRGPVYPDVGDPRRRRAPLRPRPGPGTRTTQHARRRRDADAPGDRRRRPPPARPLPRPRRRRRSRSTARTPTSSTPARTWSSTRRRRGPALHLRSHYSGTPQPVPAPTKRSDFNTTGWTITDRRRRRWTMQEPYGAYSWYAVNDQPSDKALYDFTISVPAPMVGVANGELLPGRGGRPDRDPLAARRAGGVVPRHGRDRRLHDDRGRVAPGVPISYWTPTRRADLDELREAPAGWRGSRSELGPYPYDIARFPDRRLRRAAWRPRR